MFEKQPELLKTAVFWVVTLLSLVEVYQHFKGTCCLHHQVLMMVAASGTKAASNPVHCD
jgi:hypothetical protein